jgi:hypothetical protein
MPWTSSESAPWSTRSRVSIAEWKVRHNPQRYLGHTRAGDAFPEFLVLWALFPIVFFSFSGSKLPGYILPSIPPLTILTGDYLNRIRRGPAKMAALVARLLCALLVFVLVLAPQHMKYETLVPSAQWLADRRRRNSATLLRRRLPHHPPLGHLAGLQRHPGFPILAMLVFLLGFHGKELDLNYSARPLARRSSAGPRRKLVAVESVKRDMDYGLAFYRNEPMIHYENDGVPPPSISSSSAPTTPPISTTGLPDASTNRSSSTNRRASKSTSLRQP